MLVEQKGTDNFLAVIDCWSRLADACKIEAKKFVKEKNTFMSLFSITEDWLQAYKRSKAFQICKKLLADKFPNDLDDSVIDWLELYNPKKIIFNELDAVYIEVEGSTTTLTTKEMAYLLKTLFAPMTIRMGIRFLLKDIKEAEDITPKLLSLLDSCEPGKEIIKSQIKGV